MGYKINTLYYDAPFTDEVTRQHLYNGQVFVFSPRPSSLAFCQFAHKMIEEAFAPLDPRQAQHTLPVEEYAAILGKLKPSFIHHPEAKRHLQAILAEIACDLENTYFDVPKMRSSTSGGYLTTGIAYAWHPHRDTRYSAGLCQINWGDSNLRDRVGQCHGFSSSLLGEPGAKRFEQVQLLTGEHTKARAASR